MRSGITVNNKGLMVVQWDLSECGFVTNISLGDTTSKWLKWSMKATN